MRIFRTVTVLSTALLATTAASVGAQDFSIPSTISAEAQAAARMFTLEGRLGVLPLPDDVKGWRQAWEANEEAQKAEGQAIVARLGTSVHEITLGGVPALDLRPRSWKDNGKVLLYAHGGAYTSSPTANLSIASP